MSKRELYRIAPGALSSRVAGLDLQADGKILVTYQVPGTRGPDEGAAWASPSQPVLHPLLPMSRSYTARLVNDRVVVAKPSGRSLDEPANLLVSDLQGHTRFLVGPVADDSVSPLFDFDGQNLAWVTPTCGGVRINVAAIDATPGALRPPHCRLRLLGGARVISHQRVRVTVSCVGFTFICTSDQVVMSAPGPGGRQLAVARVIPGSSEVIGGGSVVALLRLTRTGRRLVEHHHRLRVRVTAEVRDVHQAVPPPQRRSTVAVLRNG